MTRILRARRVIAAPPVTPDLAAVLFDSSVYKVAAAGAGSGSGSELWYDSNNDGYLFIASANSQKLCVYNGAYHRVDYTTDGGATVNAGQVFEANFTVYYTYWKMFKADLSDGNYIWCASNMANSDYGNSQVPLKVWHTNDGGANWSEINEGTTGVGEYAQYGFCLPRHDGNTAFAVHNARLTAAPFTRSLYFNLVDAAGNITESYKHTGGVLSDYPVHGCVPYGEPNKIYLAAASGNVYQFDWNTKTLSTLVLAPTFTKDLVSTRNGTLLLLDTDAGPLLHVWRSTDGTLWSDLDLTGTAPASFDPGWDSLCVGPDDTLFILTPDGTYTSDGSYGGWGHSGPYPGLVSTDDGATWSLTSSFVTGEWDMNGACGIGNGA